ncbi:MAG: hypothetical protein ABJL55_00640 [Roseibium sp.]
MFHTGDEFEFRARAARNNELRALSKALRGILFGCRSQNAPSSAPRFNSNDCANDVVQTTHRAA